MVWTGSHNWSDAANVSNDENSIVIHDAVIANVFYQEFKKRFDLAIPVSDHPVLDLGPDQTVYGGDTVTLDAGGFNTYVWSTGDLTRTVMIDSSGVGYGTKKVYCRVTDSYGTQSDTVRITFKQKNPGIEENNSLISHVSLSPNPANGDVTLSFTSIGNYPVGIEILGFTGQVAWQKAFAAQSGKNTIRIEDLGLPGGLYLVRLKTEAGNLVRKLIVR
jgi:hypothetical protein